MSEKPRTVVLLSGGLNSAVMLYDITTFNKAEIVECLTFDSEFGVSHMLARTLAENLGVPFSLYSYDASPVVDTSPIDLYENQRDLQRATLFGTMIIHGIARASLLGADQLTIGLLGGDVEFYEPHEFFIYATKLLGFYSLKLSMPFWESEKSDVFVLARDLNKMVEVTRDTNSCDLGSDDIQHPWGYGCGACAGCVRRWNAWDKYLQKIGQGP
jgi:7-cyano-7-deazaguanine synthase in queuosine biosynthesis